MNKTNILKIISANIRAERARKDYTQEKLSELSNISMEYLSRIENGKVCPSIIVIANIAKALNVTLDTLLPLD